MTIHLEHWSNEPDLQQKGIDPIHFGTGEAGRETQRGQDPGFLKRSYFYMAGSQPEKQLSGKKFKYHAQVPKDKVYDIGSDHLGLRAKGDWPGDPTELERQVKLAGFGGYTNSKHPNLNNVVVMFDRVLPHRVEQMAKTETQEMIDKKWETLAKADDAAPKKPSLRVLLGGKKDLEVAPVSREGQLAQAMNQHGQFGGEGFQAEKRQFNKVPQNPQSPDLSHNPPMPKPMSEPKSKPSLRSYLQAAPQQSHEDRIADAQGRAKALSATAAGSNPGFDGQLDRIHSALANIAKISSELKRAQSKPAAKPVKKKANKIKKSEAWQKFESLAKKSKIEPLMKPPVSEAQRRAMHAAAAGNSTLGIPKSVGKEFSDADKPGKLPEKKTKKAEIPQTNVSANKPRDIMGEAGQLRTALRAEKQKKVLGAKAVDVPAVPPKVFAKPSLPSATGAQAPAPNAAAPQSRPAAEPFHMVMAKKYKGSIPADHQDRHAMASYINDLHSQGRTGEAIGLYRRFMGR